MYRRLSGCLRTVAPWIVNIVLFALCLDGHLSVLDDKIVKLCVHLLLLPRTLMAVRSDFALF